MTRTSAAAVLGMALLTACGNASATRTAPGEHCADLMATALTSPNAMVAGAYDCQAPSLISNAQASGVMSDADIETFAQSLKLSPAVDNGGAAPEFTYLVGSDEVLLIWVDSNGLVDGFQVVIHP